MTQIDQEHYEDENPLYEFPRKPAHALRGEGWAWLDDKLAPGYDDAPDLDIVRTRIMLRIANSRDAKVNDG